MKKADKQTNKLTGIISISSKGTGYVAVGADKNKGQDPEVDFKHLNTALHGDMVEIVLHPKGKGRQTAEVSRIINRVKDSFVGILELENNIFFFKPDDTKMYTDIIVPESALNGANAGDKVFVKIVSWKDPRKAPEGKVEKVLGRPGDNNVEMESIALEKGFGAKLPTQVEEEAIKIKALGIEESDYAGRRDFRGTLTFTIDPDTAKDFDDAISFCELPSLNKEGAGSGKKHHPAYGTPPSKGGELYEIGIHIADVSHYVKIGSGIDVEARERGTSVYLVDRTIPMLPEILSNDLCSLMPDQDRLTMSAVFVIDKNAQVKSEWFGKTVIHSRKRLTYEGAENSIKKANAPFHKELVVLNNLAKKLTKERFAQGAISLDQEEVQFVLDSDGTPLKVIKKERGDSNRLIEEFMLLANKKVAEVISPKNIKGVKSGMKSEGVSIYRVHDLPSKEKMADLAFFLRGLGYKITLRDGLIPSHEINKLLEGLEGKDEKDTVHRAVIRSMAKAIYSTKNIGHYGLAFSYYTHFTSPIRRYPDIIVHRLLDDYLKGKKISQEKFHLYE